MLQWSEFHIMLFHDLAQRHRSGGAGRGKENVARLASSRDKEEVLECRCDDDFRTLGKHELLEIRSRRVLGTSLIRGAAEAEANHSCSEVSGQLVLCEELLGRLERKGLLVAAREERVRDLVLGEEGHLTDVGLNCARGDNSVRHGHVGISFPRERNDASNREIEDSDVERSPLSAIVELFEGNHDLFASSDLRTDKLIELVAQTETLVISTLRANMKSIGHLLSLLDQRDRIERARAAEIGDLHRRVTSSEESSNDRSSLVGNDHLETGVVLVVQVEARNCKELVDALDWRIEDKRATNERRSLRTGGKFRHFRWRKVFLKKRFHNCHWLNTKQMLR